MPVADLPYRIGQLAKEGQYAHLARPLVKPAPSDSATPKKPTSAIALTKLRVLRSVNLCDGPTLWGSKTTESTDGEEYAFYVSLRLFATRSMVLSYLSGPEVASYCSASGSPLPELRDGDLVVTEDNYLTDEVMALTRREYEAMLQSKEKHLSIENLEQMVCKMRGIESLESLETRSKRGRKKKAGAASSAPPPPPPTPVPPLHVEGESEEEQEATAAAAASSSDRPTEPGSATRKIVKRKPRTHLRDQFLLVQNTPSRLIDVSRFGDSMHHQSGRILDRVRHGERIAKCVVLSDLFPVISDNLQSFERAMAALGSRYLPRVAEFRQASAPSVIKA